jgi:hypothetical protein
MGKGNFQRVFDVIQRDKSVIDEECKTLILRDLTEKLQEYFDFSEPPKLDVTVENGVYRVAVHFSAERVKGFYLLK